MKRIVAFYLLIAAPLAGLAHTNLSSSVPEDGAHVSAPTEIQLVFSAEVRLTAVSIRSGDGEDIPVGDIPRDTQSTFRIPINAELSAGQYQVAWRSISGDSHVVSGEFRFTVTDG